MFIGTGQCWTHREDFQLVSQHSKEVIFEKTNKQITTTKKQTNKNKQTNNNKKTQLNI